MSHSQVSFRLATPDDEPEIRALVGSVAMPGTVSVRFEREPDYFLGTTVQGDPCDVLIARHEPAGELVGVMVRATRRVYLDGRPSEVAYVGQIRIAPGSRGRWLMQRAALEVASLRDRRMPYLGVVASDNPVALGTMVGRRPLGAARVTRVADLRSLAFVLHDRSWPRRHLLPLERASRSGVDELVAFLGAYGPARQLFPMVEETDLLGGPTYRGLRLEDISVVRRAGRIAGVLGAWDQSAFKQEVLQAYSPALRRLRPGYDLLTRALGGDRLPTPGERIRTAFGALRCTADDDPDVLAALLHGARARAREQGQAFLLVGFDEREPLLRSLGRPLAIPYRSEVFLGSFAPDEAALRLDGRAVHIEVGTL